MGRSRAKGASMSTLVAIAYPDQATAEEVAGTLGRLQKEHSIKLDDAVVITREMDGKVKLHQSNKLAATGAAGGALWGGLIGLIFFVPLLGMAVGAAAGGAGGALTDHRIERKFYKDPRGGSPEGGAAPAWVVPNGSDQKVPPRISNPRAG